MRHPLEQGRLIYHIVEDKVMEISQRHFNLDSGMWVYRITDPTHTEYQEVTAESLETTFTSLPVTIRKNFKSGYTLDLEELIGNLEGNYGYENLDLESFKQKGGKL